MPNPCSAGAARVGHGVDLLELDRDEPGQRGVVAVADHAVALDDVGAVGDPAPGALEGARHRVVVGVEDADELAVGDAQRGVDVLGLGACESSTLITVRSGCVRASVEQLGLDRHRGRGVVGEHDLQAAGVLLGEEGLERLDDRVGLVGEVRRDHGASPGCRLVGPAGSARRVERVRSTRPRSAAAVSDQRRRPAPSRAAPDRSMPTW